RTGIQIGKFRFGEDAETNTRDACATQRRSDDRQCHTKVSLRGAIFREIREVRISITNYLDVMSSCCFCSQPTWAELKRRYAARVEFDWKIVLMDGAGLPKSRAQEQWYYRRSGLINRSPFMLRSASYGSLLPQYCESKLL